MPPIRVVKKPPLGLAAPPQSTKHHVPKAGPRFKSVGRAAVKPRIEQVSLGAPTQRDLERREVGFNINFNSLLADERGGRKKKKKLRGSRSPTKQVIRNGQLILTRDVNTHSQGPRRNGVQLKPLLSRPKVWIPNGSA